MRLICQTDFLPAIQVTQFGPLQYALSTLVKATLQLAPSGMPSPAVKQESACGDVAYPDADGDLAAPRFPADFTPWKPRADTMVVGSCHAPRGREVASCPVGFSAGVVSRQLAVRGNRHWKIRLGAFAALPEAQPFRRIELRYENSFGGEGFVRNPVGKGYRPTTAGSGSQPWPLPNIEDPAAPVETPEGTPDPVGFGPLPITWPQRAAKMGKCDAKWQKTRFPGFPDDFDWSYFNAAPQAQQIEGYLRGDEELSFLNMHPEHAEYDSRLPGLRTRCFVNTARDPKHLRFDPPGKNAPPPGTPKDVLKRGEHSYFYEVAMNLDTLWVDMDAEQLVLVWRGITPIHTDDYGEVDHLFVLTEELSQPQQPLGAYERQFTELLAKADTIEGTMATLPGGLAAQIPDLPDIDVEIAKAEAHMAEIVAESIDVVELNQQVAAGLGDKAPKLAQLAGTGLDAQLAAIFAFVDATADATEQLAQEKQTAIRQRMKELGIDPDRPPTEEEQQAVAEFQKLLKEQGIDKQLQDAHDQVRDMATGAYRSGFNLSSLGIDLSAMLLGLSGVGVDTAKLEAEFGFQLEGQPLTREAVEQRLDSGQGFEGETLLELDLSDLDFRDADFRDAVLVKVNFAEADLTKADFTRAVLSEVDFTNAKLAAANLTEANLCGSTLSEANLTGATLDNAICGTINGQNAIFKQASAAKTNFSDSDFTSGCFDEALLSEADFSKCKLDQTSFRQADLRAAAFDEATGEKTDFTAADLTKARASRDCKLPGAIFQQARMAESNWSNTDLAGADLSYARLDGSFFMKSILTDANLTAASLKGARLSKAQLQRAQLVDANLFQTSFDKADLTDADMSRANAYNADFFETILENTKRDGANVLRTVLSLV